MNPSLLACERGIERFFLSRNSHADLWYILSPGDTQTPGSSGVVGDPESAGILTPKSDGASGESFLFSSPGAVVVEGLVVMGGVEAKVDDDDEPQTPRIDCIASRS